MGPLPCPRESLAAAQAPAHRAPLPSEARGNRRLQGVEARRPQRRSGALLLQRHGGGQSPVTTSLAPCPCCRPRAFAARHGLPCRACPLQYLEYCLGYAGLGAAATILRLPLLRAESSLSPLYVWRGNGTAQLAQ